MNVALLGKKVKAGFDRGRQLANAKKQAESRERADRILALAAADILAGRPSRGRAGRIHRKMLKTENISELTVWRYLQKYSFTLSCVKDSEAHDASKQEAICAPTL